MAKADRHILYDCDLNITCLWPAGFMLKSAAANDADNDGICDGADSCLDDALNDQDNDWIYMFRLRLMYTGCGK